MAKFTYSLLRKGGPSNRPRATDPSLSHRDVNEVTYCSRSAPATAVGPSPEREQVNILPESQPEDKADKITL